MFIVQLLTAACLALSGGCLNLDQTLTINENGSAVLDTTYSLTEQSIIQSRAMFKLQEQMAAYSPAVTNKQEAASMTLQDVYTRLFLDPVEDQIKKKFEELQPYGLIVDRLKIETHNTQRYISMQITIKDLAKFAETDLFRQYGFSLLKNSDGNYRFFKPRSVADNETQSVFSESDIKLLTPILSGFRVNFKLVSPGPIISGPVSKSSPNIAEWLFDYDRDPNALLALQTKDMEVIFNGKGLNLPEVTLNKKP